MIPSSLVRLNLALLFSLAILAGCARMGLPTPAMPGSGNAGTQKMFENRVWLDEGPDASPGTLRAFLSDGTLIMTSCGETYRLSAWRWVRGPMVAWEEDGRSLHADVGLVGRDEMVLVIDLGNGETSTRQYRHAEAPVVCPDLPR